VKRIDAVAFGRGIATAALLLSILPLLACPPAAAAPVSHGPRQPGEAVLDELLLGRKTIVAKVGSNGCTTKGSFRVDVRKTEGMTALAPHYVLTILRVVPDECKAIVGDGPAILWDLEKELGLSGNYTFSVSNLVYGSTPPSDWDDEERSLVSVVRRHVKPEGDPGLPVRPEEALPPLRSQAPAPSVDAAQDGEDGGEYRRLVERIRKGERDVDFTALRMAYAKTDGYMPYGEEEGDKDDAFAAMKRKDYAEAAKLAEEGLKDNFVDPELHWLCRNAYGSLGDREKEEFHAFVLKGLLDSMRRSGDGSTPAKAVVVISEAEEDALLHDLELRAVRSETVEIGGHAYDKVEAEHLYLKINLSTTLYFNVDIPQAWLEKGPREEEPAEPAGRDDDREPARE
jgi:hypothetical protein